ncbi:uncharacterized protein LOC111042276 [Myzus persicae]|uniref:uncharacterized protein LOC111042276 n=1 Tax=Myzus persicae TaxID=13164 RepID=UPI000B939867|nr:uncharacterized protein LOC111042276 [Myzus persicae]
MKHNIIFMLIKLIFLISSGSSDDLKLFSGSPAGPYRLVIKQVSNCNPTQNNKIQHNMYLRHRANSTFIYGNTTLEIPFDDTFFLEIKMAFKDSYGIWRENVFMHKSPKACSTLKKLLGKAWNAIANGYGITKVDCPLLPGVYISPGMDASLFEKANFPKTFFYGTYKFKMYQLRENEIFGCQNFVVGFKRP